MTQIILLPKTGANRDRACTVIKSLPTDRAWRVTIEPHRLQRTEQQNRYLFGVCYPTMITQAGEALAGWDKNDLHEFLLAEHFGTERLTIGNKIHLRPLRRSSALNKQEFSDYIAFVQRFAAELGIYIADPEA